MPLSIVIDKNILGWAEKRKDQLLETYAQIFRVGTGYELPQRSADIEVAKFCKENACDLLTADTTAYLYYFEAGIKSVHITKYDEDTKADNYVLLVRIID